MKAKFPKNSNFKFVTKFANSKSEDFKNFISQFVKFASIRIT